MQGQGSYGTIIYLVLAGAAFWFLVIRPQQARRKEQAAMIASMAPGMEIVTVGGIFATVVSIDADRLRVRVADGSELEIAKRAIGQVVSPEDLSHDVPDALESDSTAADDSSTADSDSEGHA